MRPAKTKAEKMIKVDHAGENGAVNIYRAQHMISRLRAPSLLSQLEHFQQHEEEHREIFLSELNRMGVRRCVSYHFCGIGGFVLGAITGIIGPSAIAATTYAVEHVVLKHLKEQLGYLKHEDGNNFQAVSAIYEDEKAHHDTAKAQLADRALTKILIKIVSLSTEAVIRFGMR